MHNITLSEVSKLCSWSGGAGYLIVPKGELIQSLGDKVSFAVPLPLICKYGGLDSFAMTYAENTQNVKIVSGEHLFLENDAVIQLQPEVKTGSNLCSIMIKDKQINYKII
ncbi:Uncharacterised protein [Candidatus Tiddalikarchaeum anstoanum]|nr:Uncharacterised protein [Candidatus Tiddalikarchaeum anstoanum]